MRVSTGGIEPGDDDIALTVNGRTIPARNTDTVASAMVAAESLACRDDRLGDSRGVFCGMGVCHECTVSIDGDGGSLSCMTRVQEGMKISAQPPRITATAEDNEPDRPEQTLSPDVVVIGGGPAGLAAAVALGGRGLDVVLLDERSSLGGQYFKQPSKGFSIREKLLDRQYREGRQLVEKARQSGVTILSGATVWGAFGVDHLVARSAEARWVLRPRRIIIAVGAFERGVPVPGWTLPGVMSTGAGQTLLRSYQVSPGARVLVAGNGPLNIQLAAELSRAGVKIVALAELAAAHRPSRMRHGITMALSSPGLIFDGLGYLRSLALRRVPMATSTALIRLEGDSRRGVERAVLAKVDRLGRAIPGTESEHDVDAVCVGYGFLPSNDLARSLGCQHDPDPELGSLVTRVDESGHTTVPEVWVVGDAGGVRGAKVAKARGSLAGLAVAADLGMAVSDAALRGPRRTARRHLRFQDALQEVFRAPTLTHQLAKEDTIVCRCESLTLGDVRAGLSDSLSEIGSVKRATRVGMGKCQGRYCGPVVSALSSEHTERPIAERSGFAPQAPFKPVTLADVAFAGESSEPASVSGEPSP